MSNDKDIAYAIIGFGFGIWAFFHGFNRLRRMRLIENTPTSTVRGLAMGLVELEGVVRPASVLYSPITNTECAAYKFQVQQYRSNGKSGSWVTIAEGDSFHCPFYLEDATGNIKVYPSGAEMFWKPECMFEAGTGKDIPEYLVNFMEKYGIKRRGWLFPKWLRFTEWYIRDGQKAYVLGSAQSDAAAVILDDKDKLDQRLAQLKRTRQGLDKDKLDQRLAKLKKDRKWLKEVDTNSDGYISKEEWAAAVARIESELIGQMMNTVFLDNAHGIRIAQGEDRDPFIIACEDEWNLIGELSSKCILCIWGGPALSLATLAYLIWRVPMFWHF